jgi:phytoene desaturase
MKRFAARQRYASDCPIVVIGGGIGGLSAAIHLAAQGRRVIVFEQNEIVGGKMGQYRASGYRWDTGPSVITMRHVLEDLFSAASRNLSDYLDLHPVEPLTRYFWQDGSRLNASRNFDRMLPQIEAIAPGDGPGYRRFLAYAERLHRITGPVFIYDRPPTPTSFLKVHPLDILRVDGLRTMAQAQAAFVKSPHMQQFLGRFATYVGASPYLAPATLNVIAHVELNGGVYYPAGGIYAIAKAYQTVAQELGVEIVTGCGVQSIEVEADRVVGVSLANGSQVATSALIANLDVTTVAEKLLPPNTLPAQRLAHLQNSEPSGSGFVLLLGVRGQRPDLAHHNIFFSTDYRREFDDIFERGQPPRQPTIYVAISAKTTSTDAPPGCENWFVLVNVPADNGHFNWAEQATTYRDRALARLADFGLDIRGQIEVERHLTPPDIEHLTGARQGALYGASSNNRWAAFRRPHNRDPHLRGLYYAGGTTHPGGGVPMVTLSGKVASDLLLEDGF